MKNLTHCLTTPHVTIERYSELTGLPVDMINDMLADGRIPRHRIRKDMKREIVMVNTATLSKYARSNFNAVLNQFYFEIHRGADYCVSKYHHFD